MSNGSVLTMHNSITAQPSNLSINGTLLSWSGSSCPGSMIMYEVTATQVNGANSVIVFNATLNTYVALDDLVPNRSYLFSVTAYGSSCSIQPTL